MMIIIYFYCFHSEKLNVLEQTPHAVLGFFELLDRSERNWKQAAVAHSRFPLGCKERKILEKAK